MNRKPRSSLKQAATDENDPTIKAVNRRISFSGKKFVREFDTTEKPRDYDNSYEISDHTNGDDSHGTGAAATSTLLQLTARQGDKENEKMTSISIRESISTQYDQQQHNDFTLQLQTSVNLTLMPHELAKNRRLTTTMPMEFDSLSLSDVEREKLRENSMYGVPLSEKTMDLMPQKMFIDELDCKQSAKGDTMLNTIDMSCVADKENIVQQKTVLFEDNNITCDFSDIDPQQSVAAAAVAVNVAVTPKHESFAMEDRDCINYLADESTSSPLIPLDVINENNISRKLNFRQLNDALNAGRIQLFPNGPRTPTTDKIVKPPRFWHGLEQQQDQQELPLRDAIKPRGTLNFSESMMVSPVSQQPNKPMKNPIDDPVSGKKKEDQFKRNNRFSQADEFMLDNTNFLLHAKMGDETQSRNSSKSASRRETTYDNTAMELDDLEKQEAAVVAALEKVTRQQKLQRSEAINESDIQTNQRLSSTMQMNESIEVDQNQSQLAKAIGTDTSIQEPEPVAEKEYVIRRQTMHFAEAIDEDQQSPPRDSRTAARRQTMHFAEDMDEEMQSAKKEKKLPVNRQSLLMAESIYVDAEKPHKEAKPQAPFKVQSNRRRQTIHLAEDIDEDVNSQSLAPAMHQPTSGRRPTMHLAEPIEEDVGKVSNEVAPTVVQDYNIRRQTLHFAEAIDPPSPLKNVHAPSRAKTNSHRQTLLMAEPIEEDRVKPPQKDPLMEPAKKQRKQSLCFTEAIDIDMPSPIIDTQSKSQAAPPTHKSNQRRETLLMSESMEEEKQKPQLKAAALECLKERKRQTLHMSEPMEEEHKSVASAKKELPTKYLPSPLEHARCRRRDTLLMSEDIEEEEQNPQLETEAVKYPKERKRQTLHMSEPMEEEPMKVQSAASAKKHLPTKYLPSPLEHASSRRRETLLMAEAIEEEEMNPQIETTAVEHPKERRRQTLHMSEPMEEEPNRVQSISSFSQRKADLTKQLPTKYLPSPLELASSRRRETLLMSEAIEEEELNPQLPTAEMEHQSNRRQTLLLAEPIEEDLMKSETITQKEYQTSQRKTDYRKHLPNKHLPSPLEHASSRRRETLLMAEPIEEEAMQPAADNGEQSKSRRRQTLHLSEPIEEEPMQLKPLTAGHRAKPLYVGKASEEYISVAPSTHKIEQPFKPNRQTMHLAEPIIEDLPNISSDPGEKPASFAVQTHSIRKQTLHFEEEMQETGTNAMKEINNRNRQTMHLAEPIEVDLLIIPNDPKAKLAPPAVKPHGIRRQTLHFEEEIEEDIQPIQREMINEGVSSMEEKSNKRTQTMHMAEPMEEEAVNVPINLKAKCASFALQMQRIHRQTLHFEEEMEEEIQPLQREMHSSVGGGSLEQKSNKHRQTLHLAEPIEEDSFSGNIKQAAAPIDSRQEQRPTLHLREVIKKEPTSKSNQRQTLALAIDDSCIKIVPTYPALLKPHQTLCMSVDMNEDDMPATTPPEPSSIQPRMTFLENMDLEFLSPVADKAGCDSPSDSGEWLAQKNAKLRKTWVNPNNDKTESRKVTIETPKNKKMMQRSCLHITPGRSIIEYEDLEEMCNIDISEVATTNAASKQSVDMEVDKSIFGTPLASFNVKRLPTHLTPNLPQPKKRNTQYSEIQNDSNNSQIQLDITVKETDTHLSTSRNKSHIPVLRKSLNSPYSETEQIDGTVQMVRAQMIRQTRSLFCVETLRPMEQNLKERTIATYEDNPITISDVSSHFAAQKELAKQDAKNTSSTSGSSNENSNKSYGRSHKKFLNLSGDTEIFDAAEVIDLSLEDNEIEKTRLSLVSTLIDEEEASIVDGVGIELKADPELITEPEACLERVNPPAAAGSVDACKKCTHCRRSLSGTLENGTDETFELPNWNALELGLERLKRLRQHPTLDDVERYFELKDMERYSSASDLSESSDEDTHRITLQDLLADFKRKCEEMLKNLPEPVIVGSYAKRLKTALQEQLPRWIFDCELQCDRQYIVTHKTISTFRLVINYEPLDIMETDIKVRKIKATTFNTIITKSQWGVLSHLMDFQLRLALPLNLMILLDGNKVDDVVKFLKHIDSICVKTKKLCNDLRLLLISKQALLIRQPNRTVVRKTIRKMTRTKDEAHSRYEKTNFIIEITNVEKLSFENILEPPLYHFDEKIQFLPKGIAFLDTFLEHPEQYLKPITQPTN
ncbi:uncharacterized protein LOC117567359 [Drosophila albomicans]|uniref:Uncharacterized protein LOC117567359 n=1 Tax=Drosophila albomicans TaxID=7291 RepID=A0A6P8WUW1_DROAB|nr:uncharacterized protein LOC117567359 [Drosophila albomicans]